MARFILPILFAVCAAYSAYQAIAPVMQTIAGALTVHLSEDKAGKPVNQR
jgi:hypothetical protein